MLIEPHPDCDSLNRTLASHAAALDWARGTHGRKGWPIVDQAARVAPITPAARSGSPRVRIEQTSQSWIVRVEPRPWGSSDAAREFFSRDHADRYAADLREQLSRAALTRRSGRKGGAR